MGEDVSDGVDGVLLVVEVLRHYLEGEHCPALLQEPAIGEGDLDLGTDINSPSFISEIGVAALTGVHAAEPAGYVHIVICEEEGRHIYD